jgi:hypothetical protein
MSIGVLNEGPLHAALKAAYSANGGEEEVSVQTFVADAVRNGIMYEIQTGSFSGLRRKMAALADVGPVVLVHPIARTTTIVKQPEDRSAKPASRKSPKRGSLIHIVNELVYLPQMLNHPNFSVEAVLTEVREIRVFDPKKNRRRGGWRVQEKHLLDIIEGVRLQDMADLFNFLQMELPSPFDTRDLAAALDEPLDIAQKMAYCLRHAGVTEIVGKKGNALLYEYGAPG